MTTKQIKKWDGKFGKEHTKRNLNEARKKGGKYDV